MLILRNIDLVLALITCHHHGAVKMVSAVRLATHLNLLHLAYLVVGYTISLFLFLLFLLLLSFLRPNVNEKNLNHHEKKGKK